MAQFEGCRN